jgi:asparagine synthase (glutamine-hydrolysing)
VVLATAAAVARRDGLPLPIPTTYRFADAPGSHEDDWQEQVVRHVGVPDWQRLPLTAELDTVGPVARSVLVRHGLLWPFNAHFHMPVLERAAGGSLLTGIGGDELFGTQLWSSARALFGGRHPRRVRLPSVGVALAPRTVRRWALARRRQLRFPWLRPGVEEEVNRRLADWRARTPLPWRGGVAWWWRSRYRTVLAASMDALAAGAGASVVHPFLDPAVVGAVARHFGARGPADRSSALAALFGDVLPEPALSRRSKAHFDDAFISDHARSFAAGWTGTGVDQSLVDPDRLAEEWRSEHPDPRSLLLMQAAWLASR